LYRKAAAYRNNQESRTRNNKGGGEIEDALRLRNEPKLTKKKKNAKKIFLSGN